MEHKAYSEHTDRKGEKHVYFSEETALAEMLLAECVFLNSYHWRDAHKEDTAILLNCNDLFAWGCADAEELRYADIKQVYDAWLADPRWGTDKWCCKRRKERPQKPVERDMRAAGAWDDEMEALPLNETDAALAAQIAGLVAGGALKPAE